MKILWLQPSTGDNISVRRDRIAEVLEARGHEVVIQNATGLDAFGAIADAVTREFDILVGNVRIGLYLGYPVARILGRPFVGDVSDPIDDIDDRPDLLVRLLEWYEWKVLRRSDAAVFVYESSYRAARRRGIDGAVKLPNAVDYDAFADPDPAAVRDAARIMNSAGIHGDKPLAIHIGVLSPSYCVEAILDAAERTPSWEFLLLGEGALSDLVRDRARRQQNVSFPGSFEYRLMPGFLAHAQVGFCFKDGEQPLKLREYGAAGVPTIARPGALERWYDDDELFFVHPDGEAIGDALRRLSDEPELASRYRRHLRQRVREWSWDAVADGYEDLFQRIDTDA